MGKVSSIGLDKEPMSALFDPRYEALFGDWLGRYGGNDRVPLLGIAGAQGCGKSSLAAHLAAKFECAQMSLDDFYLTKAARQTLAKKVHPLFATRGLPLTHDLTLASNTILALKAATPNSTTPLPAFDKIADDRRDPSNWPRFNGRPKAIIIEGWCLSATAIPSNDLLKPINNFEREHDPDGGWRTRWNDALGADYQDFFAKFDAILHLAAPSFDVVLDWRCEQEEGLLKVAAGNLNPVRRAELAQFVASFERLTRHMLAGGISCQAVANLDTNRHVQTIKES
jgi:D-glycerate 3-kinase